jgi:hypothetical protein
MGPPKTLSGPAALVFYSLQGREVARVSGTVNEGKLSASENVYPRSCGAYRVAVFCGALRADGTYMRME